MDMDGISESDWNKYTYTQKINDMKYPSSTNNQLYLTEIWIEQLYSTEAKLGEIK
jgi:hypothetical protein